MLKYLITFTIFFFLSLSLNAQIIAPESFDDELPIAPQTYDEYGGKAQIAFQKDPAKGKVFSILKKKKKPKKNIKKSIKKSTRKVRKKFKRKVASKIKHRSKIKKQSKIKKRKKIKRKIAKKKGKRKPVRMKKKRK